MKATTYLWSLQIAKLRFASWQRIGDPGEDSLMCRHRRLVERSRAGMQSLLGFILPRTLFSSAGWGTPFACCGSMLAVCSRNWARLLAGGAAQPSAAIDRDGFRHAEWQKKSQPYTLPLPPRTQLRCTHWLRPRRRDTCMNLHISR